MIRLTTQFTIEMREAIGKLLQVFWDIQRQLARLERFLPKQIDLPVVRFRDAFNKMRSLPYDLSRQWQTFQGLVAVIFMNRQGLHRVNKGQYFVTDVRIGQRLNPTFWSNAIEPGDELSMTMILDDIEAEDGFCPYKSCGASTKDVTSIRGGKTCPNCCRFASISQKKQDSDEFEEYEADAVPAHAPELEAPEEDIELYHSIQVVQALLARTCDEAGSSERPSLQTPGDGSAMSNSYLKGQDIRQNGLQPTVNQTQAPVTQYIQSNGYASGTYEAAPTSSLTGGESSASSPQSSVQSPTRPRPRRVREETYVYCCRCANGPVLLKLHPSCTECNARHCRDCLYQKR
jgi:hypothetical protein